MSDDDNGDLMMLDQEVNSQNEDLMMNRISMEDKRNLDSLWIDTPRGLLHIYINGDGTWEMTAWNSKGDKITKKKAKPRATFYHIAQVLNE